MQAECLESSLGFPECCVLPPELIGVTDLRAAPSAALACFRSAHGPGEESICSLDLLKVFVCMHTCTCMCAYDHMSPSIAFYLYCFQFIYLCFYRPCMSTNTMVHMCRVENNLWELILSTVWFLRYQAWLKVPLSTEPPCQPIYLVF